MHRSSPPRAAEPRTAEALRGALAALVDGLPPRRAATAVERLIAYYRGDTPTGAPVLRDRADAVAYAAYRMPATYEAVAAALTACAVRAPGWSPGSHLDLGGGTGAAVWAAEAVWGDGPHGRTRATTVLDWAEPALALGRELAAGSGAPALEAARWEGRRFSDGPGGSDGPDPGGPGDHPSGLPGAELVTVSYVLGELTPRTRRAVVEAAVRAAGEAVVLVEPGTPDGYRRVLEARGQLTEAGLTVLAPCPHSARCPIVPGEDWCHFAARVPRSSLHRQVKGGSLPYEDEKFSYVAAVRGPRPGGPAEARVVRKPQLRKGLVLLDLCTREEELRRTTVSKRHGAHYRAARDADWGDAWPPPQPDTDTDTDTGGEPAAEA